MRDPVRPDALERIWDGVRRRADAFDSLQEQITGPSRERFVGARHWLGAAALGIVGLGVGFVLWLFVLASVQPTALLLEDGSAFSELEVPAGAPMQQVDFGDGSRLQVEPGSAVSGLASTPSEFIVLLERGRAHFSVVPGGPRRWVVEAELGRVEVIGTEFTMARQSAELRVRVDRGAVLLRSPLVANGVRRIDAGESALLRRATAGETPASVVAPVTPSALPRAPAQERSAGVRDEVSARPVAGAAQTRRMSASQDAVGRLLNEADEARMDREFARAVRLLSRVIEEHPGDSRAGLAAFGRGILQLQQLNQPRQATQSFSAALGGGIPHSLREDCYLRWLEAELTLGRTAQARALRLRYEAEFPNGRHLNEMNRQLEGE